MRSSSFKTLFKDAVCVDLQSVSKYFISTFCLGKNCEKNVDDCARVTCLNDGKCKDFLNNFTCDCHPGFEGKFCKRNIDECASGPCRNGGTCLDGIADYKCLCTSEWSGMF